jgi:hypothetical protein
MSYAVAHFESDFACPSTRSGFRQQGTYTFCSSFSRSASAKTKNDRKKKCRRGEGPYIAWFKDPAGNILSVLQEK